ncbi:MAG: hypothetical protein H0X51_09290 [Parachlamydiaceae bacterium]|nr:hypothetical protein [Parachlamydiaceae bacterium]
MCVDRATHFHKGILWMLFPNSDDQGEMRNAFGYPIANKDDYDFDKSCCNPGTYTHILGYVPGISLIVGVARIIFASIVCSNENRRIKDTTTPQDFANFWGETLLTRKQIEESGALQQDQSIELSRAKQQRKIAGRQLLRYNTYDETIKFHKEERSRAIRQIVRGVIESVCVLGIVLLMVDIFATCFDPRRQPAIKQEEVKST